jgi:hypothetical protein
MTLQGSGILTNAGSCFLTLQGLQLFPSLRGEVNFSARGPVLFTPANPVVATDHKTGVLRQSHYWMVVPEPTVNQHLYSSHRSGRKHTPSCACILPGTREGKLSNSRLSVAGVILAIFLVYYFTHSHLRTLTKRCIHKSDLDVNTQKPQAENPSTSQPNLTGTEEKHLDKGPPTVRYSTYSLQTAWDGGWFNYS